MLHTATSSISRLFAIYQQYVSQRRKNKKCNTAKRKYSRKLVNKMILQILPIVYVAMQSINECHAGGSRLKSLRYQDYCPKMGSCLDESHVMCQNNMPQTHECEETENRTMTSEMAGYILQVTNAMRSRLALGVEKGKDGVPLPRGYGLRRLQWDPELATFAQLWADTCRNDKDLCHATKKFNDPGQFLVNFRLGASHGYPEMDADEDKANGFTDKKLLKYITSMLKYIFSRKNIVTPDIVHQVTLEDSSKTAYHQFMNDEVTHIGCGLSIFSKYFDNKNLIKNIKFVCNLSAKLVPQSSLYRTRPPTSEETQRCGCQQGYSEDEGCLCYEQDPNGPCGLNHGKCKPAVIVLPILRTVESYPIYSVQNVYSNRYMNTSKTKLDVRTRHFDKSPKRQTNKQKNISKRKQSLFLEVPKFVLPYPYKPDSTEKSEMKSGKRNIIVVPRKDFSLARGLVGNYLISQRVKANKYQEEKNRADNNDFVKNVQANFDSFGDNSFRVKGANESSDPEKTSYNKGYDANVMNLLDKLEKQIHDKPLNGDVKQVVDAKIRKLYGNIIGRADANLNVNHIQEVQEHEHFNQEHDHQHSHEHNHVHEHDMRFTEEKRNTNQGYMNKIWDKDIGYVNDRQFRNTEDYGHRNVYGNNYHENYANNKFYGNRLEDEDMRSYQNNRFYHDHSSIKNRKVEISVPNQQQYNLNRPVQRFVRPLADDTQERLLLHDYPINKRGIITISKIK